MLKTKTKQLLKHYLKWKHKNKNLYSLNDTNTYLDFLLYSFYHKKILFLYCSPEKYT